MNSLRRQNLDIVPTIQHSTFLFIKPTTYRVNYHNNNVQAYKDSIKVSFI